MGSVETFSASASQPARVWIARQASSQRETTAPPSSWARNFDGTAIRPLSSTECRYSPVNTDGLPQCGLVMERAAGDCYPTLGHIPPLPGIIARSEAPSMGKSTRVR